MISNGCKVSRSSLKTKRQRKRRNIKSTWNARLRERLSLPRRRDKKKPRSRKWKTRRQRSKRRKLLEKPTCLILRLMSSRNCKRPSRTDLRVQIPSSLKLRLVRILLNSLTRTSRPRKERQLKRKLREAVLLMIRPELRRNLRLVS